MKEILKGKFLCKLENIQQLMNDVYLRVKVMIFLTLETTVLEMSGIFSKDDTIHQKFRFYFFCLYMKNSSIIAYPTYAT